MARFSRWQTKADVETCRSQWFQRQHKTELIEVPLLLSKHANGVLPCSFSGYVLFIDLYCFSFTDSRPTRCDPRLCLGLIWCDHDGQTKTGKSLKRPTSLVGLLMVRVDGVCLLCFSGCSRRRSVVCSARICLVLTVGQPGGDQASHHKRIYFIIISMLKKPYPENFSLIGWFSRIWQLGLKFWDICPIYSILLAWSNYSDAFKLIIVTDRWNLVFKLIRRWGF